MADVPAGSVTIFTDPYCPWSWAAEPHLRRLEVEFGAAGAPSFVIVGLHRRIEKLERISRPGLRIYRGREDIKPVMNGLGVAIVSTSRGVMTDRRARETGVGGEVLCIVV